MPAYECYAIPAQTLWEINVLFCQKKKGVYEMHGLQLSCLWYYSTHSVILENHLTSVCDWELGLKAAIHIHRAGATSSSEAFEAFYCQ